MGDSPEAIRDEGRLAEASQSLLSLLEDRNLPVSAAVREKILACRDLETLRRWLVRGVKADRTEEILGES